MAPKKDIVSDTATKKIQKRDGSIVPFDIEKIVNAIFKAMNASGEGSQGDARIVATKIKDEILDLSKKYGNFIPTVEGIQDMVEKELILGEYVQTAKAYILYREERSQLRMHMREIPPESKKISGGKQEIFSKSARRIRLLPDVFALDGRRRQTRDMDRDRRQIYFFHERKSWQQIDGDRI